MLAFLRQAILGWSRRGAEPAAAAPVRLAAGRPRDAARPPPARRAREAARAGGRARDGGGDRAAGRWSG